MIISADELKKTPELSKLDDERLSLMASAVESSIRASTRNLFIDTASRQTVRCSHGSISGHAGIKDGDTVYLRGSGNDGIFEVKDSDGTLTIDPMPYDGTAKAFLVKYPPDVVLGATEMIRYDATRRSKSGIASEKLSRYSVTYADAADLKRGYPPELLGFLSPYVKWGI